MKKLFIALLIFTSLTSQAQLITDSIGAVHYKISVTDINYAQKKIKAVTEVKIKAEKDNILSVPLSLQQLTVDSILIQGSKVSFSYVTPELRINLSTALMKNDEVDIRIFYQGAPKSDPVFGGFTFSGNYAFNIGVGFQANPHNMGKVWFPCIDEFEDKATYEFFITTPVGYKAFCNGLLQGQTTDPVSSKPIWHWKIDQPIPTYLASMAVAPFYTIRKNYKGIPMEWAVMPADSTPTKTTFAKIDTAMSAFIKAYGPYPFDRVGYVSVPFSGGAMEHAASIHIGKVFVDGTLNYETLWAHELSHMWWGDKMTCKTAGDMWLNEGFASFNEFYFTEAAYGKTAYKNAIRTLHKSVLETTHIKDDGYLSLKDVPHAYTYENTVYKKGPDMVHTLRGYLGDDLFFQGCKDFLNKHAFKNADSDSLSISLTATTGINTTRFFQDWIFTPGFPHFSIDSTTVTPSGNNFTVKVITRQRQKGNTHTYKMPVECYFSDGVNDSIIALTIDATTNEFTVTLPFSPGWIALDRKEKLSDAIVDYEKNISDTGMQALPETNAILNVRNKGTGSSVLRVEHNYVKPVSSAVPQGLRISEGHYWTVDGNWAPGFEAQMIFNYYTGTADYTGISNNKLIKANEDSLVVLYRPNINHSWAVVNFTIDKGQSSTDKSGKINILNLKKGEYVLANGLVPVTSGIHSLPKKGKIKIYPNPAGKKSKSVKIDLNPQDNLSIIKIHDLQGKLLFSEQLKKLNVFEFNIEKLASGTYLLTVEGNGEIFEEKLVIEN